MPDLSPLPFMLEPLWWMIPGVLAGAPKPTQQEVDVLQRQGIGAIVSLLSDDSNLELYEQKNVHYLWLPIEGGRAPSLEQFHQLCEFVAVQSAASRAIAIHCSSGRRRTGTILAALLIQQGMSYDKAMGRLWAANPAIELREAQINFLQGLAAKRASALFKAHHPVQSASLSRERLV